VTISLFLLASGTADRFDVVMKPRCIHLAIAANFFNNGITPHDYTSMNSWGVQIVGGS